MKPDAFAHTFDDTKSKFYLKPKYEKDQLYYLVEPYQQKIKPFKLTRRPTAEVNGTDKKEWEILDTTVHASMKKLENNFSDLVQENLATA